MTQPANSNELNKKNLTILLKALVKQVDNILKIANKRPGEHLDTKELAILKSLYNAIYDFIIKNLDVNDSAVKVLADEINDTIPSSLTLNYSIMDNIFVTEISAIKTKIEQLEKAGIVDDATIVRDFAPQRPKRKVSLVESIDSFNLSVKISDSDATIKLLIDTNRNLNGHRFIKCTISSNDTKLSTLVGDAIFVIGPGKAFEVYKNNRVYHCNIQKDDVDFIDKLIQDKKIDEISSPELEKTKFPIGDRIDLDLIVRRDSTNLIKPLKLVSTHFYISDKNKISKGDFIGIYGITESNFSVLFAYNQRYDKFVVVPATKTKETDEFTGEPYEFLFSDERSLKILCDILGIKSDNKYLSQKVI